MTWGWVVLIFPDGLALAGLALWVRWLRDAPCRYAAEMRLTIEVARLALSLAGPALDHFRVTFAMLRLREMRRPSWSNVARNGWFLITSSLVLASSLSTVLHAYGASSALALAWVSALTVLCVAGPGCWLLVEAALALASRVR